MIPSSPFCDVLSFAYCIRPSLRRWLFGVRRRMTGVGLMARQLWMRMEDLLWMQRPGQNTISIRMTQQVRMHNQKHRQKTVLAFISVKRTSHCSIRTIHPQQMTRKSEMTRRLIATLCLLLSTAFAFTGNPQWTRPQTTKSQLSPSSSLKLEPSRRNFSPMAERSRASTQLQMSAVPVGAFAGILTGGLFAGGLHAIAGRFLLLLFDGNPVTARPPR